MYALQPQPSRPQPVRRASVNSQPRPRPTKNLHQTIALETGIKLGVNVGLSLVAIVAVVQLLPYRTTQETKLQELQVAVKSAGERVHRTQVKFNRYFDPYQARTLMQEQSNRIDPHQRQIVWQEPKVPVNPTTALTKVTKPAERPKPKGY